MKRKRSRSKSAVLRNRKMQTEIVEKSDSVAARRRRPKKTFFTTKRITIMSVAIVVFVSLYLLAPYIVEFCRTGGGMLKGYDGTDGEFEKVETAEIEKGTGKFTFVIAGVDKVAGATDTIMIGCYNLDENEINIISVPRDTRMYIGSKYQKINAAYGIKKNGVKKGMNGTIEAVKRLTGVQEVNHYVEFNLKAFRDTIDALGGVDFDVPRNMYHKDEGQDLLINLKAGMQHLDGDKAEQLVRFRGYPMGDIDRVKVQQDFIKAIAEQKLNVGIIEKVPELFGVIQENIRTDLYLDEIIKYSYNLKDLKAENVHLYNLPGYPNDTDYGASYWIADIDEVKKLVSEIFDCDASGATIHSADGSSALADTKKKPSPSPTAATTEKPTTTPKATVKPTQSPKATAKPTQTPKATETAKPVETVKPTVTPKATPKTTQSPGDIKRPSAN